MFTTVNRMGRAWLSAMLVLVSWQSAPAAAQEPETPTRTSLIEQAQAEKERALRPYTPGAAEKYLE